MMPDPRWRLAMALVWSVLFFAAAFLLWQRDLRRWPLIPRFFLAVYGVYGLGIMIAFF